MEKFRSGISTCCVLAFTFVVTEAYAADITFEQVHPGSICRPILTNHDVYIGNGEIKNGGNSAQTVVCPIWRSDYDGEFDELEIVVYDGTSSSAVSCTVSYEGIYTDVGSATYSDTDSTGPLTMWMGNDTLVFQNTDLQPYESWGPLVVYCSLPPAGLYDSSIRSIYIKETVPDDHVRKVVSPHICYGATPSDRDNLSYTYHGRLRNISSSDTLTVHCPWPRTDANSPPDTYLRVWGTNRHNSQTLRCRTVQANGNQTSVYDSGWDSCASGDTDCHMDVHDFTDWDNGPYTIVCEIPPKRTIGMNTYYSQLNNIYGREDNYHYTGSRITKVYGGNFCLPKLEADYSDIYYSESSYSWNNDAGNNATVVCPIVRNDVDSDWYSYLYVHAEAHYGNVDCSAYVCNSSGACSETDDGIVAGSSHGEGNIILDMDSAPNYGAWWVTCEVPDKEVDYTSKIGWIRYHD